MRKNRLMAEKRGSTKAKTPPLRKSFPIGVSGYRDACTNYYYVDKTLLIRDLLDERAKVSLFNRPRRFGKTLNPEIFA